MRILRALLSAMTALLLASPVMAQGPRRTVTVTTAAPIFVTPNATQPPLRTAPVGALLGLLEANDDWCHVEFEDPQYGRRVGYIQTKNVRVNPPGPPANAGAPEAGGGQASAPAGQTPVPPAAPRPPAPPVPQRGDLAVGYVFMHEDGLSFPFGVAGSGAWRLLPIVDLVGEAQYARGTSDLVTPSVDVSVWTVLGGPRVWSGVRYGGSIRGFVQGLVGVVGIKGADLDATKSTTGFGLQPGFGVEVQASRQLAIRPEFDVLFRRIDGESTTDLRFGFNIVLRQLR